MYETGQTVADNPVIYHDYRITALASSSLYHFGRILITEDATDIVFTTDDFAVHGSVATDWTVTGLTDDGNEYRLDWAAPASGAQPVRWESNGANVTNQIELPAVDRTIGGTAYKIYLTDPDARYDDVSNGVVFTVTT